MSTNQHRITKLRDDYKQYGFWGFQKLLLKFFLRIIGIEVNSYFYMVNKIDGEARHKQFVLFNINDVKTLTYQDFLLGDKDMFTEKKLKTIKTRLADGTYIPYGIVREGKLIYSCWISMREMELSDNCLIDQLNEYEVLLLDDYCSPIARGKGIHTAMNAYRLWQIAQKGGCRALVIIIKENKPAYKSQLRVGFKVAFDYFIVKFGGKTYTNYYKRKLSYIENDGKRNGL